MTERRLTPYLLGALALAALLASVPASAFI
jgi:hypothetical protein